MSYTSGLSLRRCFGVVPALGLLLALALAGCGTSTQPEPTSPPAVTQATGAATATTAGSTAPTAGGTGTVDSTQALVDALVKAGMTLTSTGPINQPFFSVKGNTYETGKGYLQIFEYPDEAAAKADAAKVKSDGTIEGFSVDWVASPHFYQMGKFIVIYLGDDAADLAALKSVLGDPFATAQVRRLP